MSSADSLSSSERASSNSSEAGPTVLIIGAGVSGLATAVSLAAVGCDVHVYEQFETTLPSVQAGFPYSQPLQAFLARHCPGSDAVDLAIAGGRQVLQQDAEVTVHDSSGQEYISRDSLRSALLRRIPPAQYHTGCRVVSVDVGHPAAAIIELESGERICGNLVVAADGIDSRVRQQLLPKCQPTYAGYLAWRGVAHTDALSPATLHLLADKFTMYRGAYLHMQVYPLPDPEAALITACRSCIGRSRPGGAAAGAGTPSKADLKATLLGTRSEAACPQRIAWTWFNNQVEEELPGLLLDREARPQPHAVAMGELNPAVADAVATAAAEALPAPLAELVAHSTSQMSVSAVSDMVLSGCVIANKVVLVGQAGSVIRPHSCSSAQQAVLDAASLAAALKEAQFALDRALPRWEAQQVHRNLSACHAAVAAGERMQGFAS